MEVRAIGRGNSAEIQPWDVTHKKLCLLNPTHSYQSLSALDLKVVNGDNRSLMKELKKNENLGKGNRSFADNAHLRFPQPLNESAPAL